MEYVFFALALAAVIVGIIGCFVPVLPGPPIAFAGVMIVYFTTDEVSTPALFVYGLVTLLTVVLDYIIPMLGVKYFGGTKYGKWGCFIGSIIGLFYLPWGIIAGPFFGAFIGELIGKNSARDAAMSGVGSLLGFICGVLLKLIVCFYFLWVCLSGIWCYIFQ